MYSRSSFCNYTILLQENIDLLYKWIVVCFVFLILIVFSSFLYQFGFQICRAVPVIEPLYLFLPAW